MLWADALDIERLGEENLHGGVEALGDGDHHLGAKDPKDVVAACVRGAGTRQHVDEKPGV